MIGRIKDFVRTVGGESIITLVTRADCAEEIDELKDSEIDITLKKHYAKRSRNANAYAWVLINEIARKIKQTPEEVYREAIRHIAGVSEYLCMRKNAVEAFCRAWSRKGIGWLTETESSKIDGCMTVKVWYGSSVYDKEQMNALIDNLTEDARSLHITVETPDEIARIKSLWGNEQ